MYSIAVGLLILVIILAPIMLFTKPCIVLATSKPEEEKEGMIEFKNLNGEDDESDEAGNANDMNANDMNANDMSANEMNEGGEGSITEESELMEGGGMDVVAMRQKELR
jgi:hypothetical protein